MRLWSVRLDNWLLGHLRRGAIPAVPLTIILASVIGVLGGFGAVLFTSLIRFVSDWSVEPVLELAGQNRAWFVLLALVPALGLVAVSWFTRRFAPEAQGHGVPEVITAVARQDGVIRPRVSLVKILASGLCIGTGGSAGREGPIVQIGSSIGSMAGQLFGLSAENIKVLVACGAAAGISATFNAPLAGVMFATEIILGNFAVRNLTPIVVASVLADVVQTLTGQYGFEPAFPHLYHRFHGAWEQLPSYVLLGLFCGLAAVTFTKLLYAVEDVGERWLPSWWQRALVFGSLVGAIGASYQLFETPILAPADSRNLDTKGQVYPALFGVGYDTVGGTLHLENQAKVSSVDGAETGPRNHDEIAAGRDKIVLLDSKRMLTVLWWLLPLAVLKPLLTSLTLGGGGSGGIFAPSLFLGATLGASFGIICNWFLPGASANPGAYAIVGMGAVVAGTTHGMLSAILIVYEMTSDYRIILPIMVAAGLSTIVAGFIDPESIYHKKLSRRGESVARGHDLNRLEHVMVRDVMLRKFPTVRHTDSVTEVIGVAQANPHIESLAVMDDDDKLVGIIRPEALHRILDSNVSTTLINAGDVALTTTFSVSADANLLEALREFGALDVETLPVESGRGKARRLVGLLLRTDVMQRYRAEMLRR